MDKSWMNLSRVDARYFRGVEEFINFVRERSNAQRHPCPCRHCKGSGEEIGLVEMRQHLLNNGMMHSYTVWKNHGEDIEQLEGRYEANDPQRAGASNYITMELLNDAFPLRNFPANDMGYEDLEYVQNERAYEKYCSLLEEAQKPIFVGSEMTILKSILDGLQVKVESGWSDKSFDKHLAICKGLLPRDNNYPGSYREVKKLLKKLGLSYEVFHACEHGCTLFRRN